MEKILKTKILVITPIKHIAGIQEKLEMLGEVTYLDDPSESEVIEIIASYDAIFTNPNKSKVYIGKNILDASKKLKVICTASTGTNHISKDYALNKGIAILSLTEERSIISKISSTAELAFGLTLAGIRNIIPSHSNALMDQWDYTKYIGRQMNCLTIGIIGYGRLGSMYANYCKAFGSKIFVFDPYKSIEDDSIVQVKKITELLSVSDVIAIHVHVTKETSQMIDKKILSQLKKNVLLINTSRGDIIDENDLVYFLKNNPSARIGTDVLANEVRDRQSSPLLSYAKTSNQVIITQHIGGMTSDAQEIAYGHAVFLLNNFFNK